MEIANLPTKFPIPFAADAGSGYIRPIPEASQIGITPGAASLTDGFPPVTFLAVGAGGVPPSGEDFNGLLNQITLWNQWQQAGGPIPYDAGFSTAIGGYPKGATLAAAIGGFWVSLVDNNITDPDTGGAGWIMQTRARLSQNTTFYVATGGSDTNGNGTSGNPWLTAQHASDVLQQNYDLNGFVATIYRQDGSYTDPVHVTGTYIGAKGPTSVVFSGSGSGGVSVTTTANTYFAEYGAQFSVNNQTISSTSGSSIVASSGATINTTGLNYGPSGYHNQAFVGSSVNITGNNTLSGSATGFGGAFTGGTIVLNAGVLTITGTPAFTEFVFAEQGGVVLSASQTFTGSATGLRYNASLNGVIDTTGGGANYFPGNSPGTTATGGQYN